MFMLNGRAITFISLNAVRALSIISLILVFSSTIMVMVNNIKAVNAFEAHKNETDMLNCDYIENSTVPNQPAGVFWAIVASLLIIFQSIILFLSEINTPIRFFDRYFPVLGSHFGLGPLGIFQALISSQILSHHVDDFALVAGFFLFAIGCLNMLLGLIFRESAKSKRSITDWRSEVKSVLPTHTGSTSMSTPPSFKTSTASVYVPRELGSIHKSPIIHEKSGYGFGRQGEKAAGLKGFLLQKPEEALPRYMSPPPMLSRKGTRRSSESSFDSPDRRESRRSESEDEEPESHRKSGSSEGRSTPRFKSSKTAI